MKLVLLVDVIKKKQEPGNINKKIGEIKPVTIVQGPNRINTVPTVKPKEA